MRPLYIQKILYSKGNIGVKIHPSELEEIFIRYMSISPVNKLANEMKVLKNEIKMSNKYMKMCLISSPQSIAN